MTRLSGGGEYGNECLLRCVALQSGNKLSIFWNNHQLQSYTLRME